MWAYRGLGGGTFAKRVLVGQGWRGYTLATGHDQNGDLNGDIVARDRYGNLWFYAGLGNGRFAKAVRIATGW